MNREQAANILSRELQARTDAYYYYLQSGGKHNDNEEDYLDALDIAVKVLLWANIQHGGD